MEQLVLTRQEARVLQQLIRRTPTHDPEEVRLLRDFLNHLTDPMVPRKDKTDWIKELS